MKTRALTSDEQARIDHAVAAFCQMALDAGLVDDEDNEGQDVFDLADELIIRWASEPREARLPDEVIATIVGATLGDFLLTALRVKWGALTSGPGSIGLVDEASGEPLFSPFDAVRDRLSVSDEDMGEGVLAELADELLETYGRMRREES